MRYFYIYPFKPQYFFPEEFAGSDFMSGFYAPYTSAGSAWWWIWRKFNLVRQAFSVDESGIPCLKEIKDLTGANSVIAINLGTEGPEQKTTAIGYDKAGRKFFVKYAVKEKAKQLVANEYKILSKLTYIKGIPEVLNYYISSSGTLLQTGFTEGVKSHDIDLSSHLIELLMTLARIPERDFADYSGGFKGKRTFAHGDFCPWNMLISKGQVHLVDWEMAGYHPAGYDLFTFIFQTRFLLQPSCNPLTILESNTAIMRDYFSELGITDWRKYLEYFVKSKMQYYKEKHPGMAKRYSQILNSKIT